MTQRKKFIQKFLACPSEVRFEDVRRLLIDFGFEEVSCKGSHHTFWHEDGREQTIPIVGGRKVRKVYIRQIIDLLNLEDADGYEEEN